MILWNYFWKLLTLLVTSESDFSFLDTSTHHALFSTVWYKYDKNSVIIFLSGVSVPNSCNKQDTKHMLWDFIRWYMYYMLYTHSFSKWKTNWHHFFSTLSIRFVEVFLLSLYYSLFWLFFLFLKLTIKENKQKLKRGSYTNITKGVKRGWTEVAYLRWLNTVMQDHEARASGLNRKLIFSFFLLFS